MAMASVRAPPTTTRSPVTKVTLRWICPRASREAATSATRDTAAATRRDGLPRCRVLDTLQLLDRRFKDRILLGPIPTITSVARLPFGLTPRAGWWSVVSATVDELLERH